MHSRRVAGPRHSLEAIQRLIRDFDAFDLAMNRALRTIIAQRRCTAQEARAFTAEAVLTLSADDYSETIEYAGGVCGDVYGKLIEARGWYIKLALAQSPDQVRVMSFHLAQYPVHTRSGIVPRGPLG
jgi:hypothetical protein